MKSSKLRLFLNKSVVRLIALIFALLLPINILTLVMSDLTIREAEKQVTINARNDLNLSIGLHRWRRRVLCFLQNRPAAVQTDSGHRRPPGLHCLLE